MVQQNQSQQERIVALTVQAQWFQAVLIGIGVAGAVLTFLPKVIRVVKEEKK